MCLSAQVPDGPRASAIWSRFTVLACRCERDTHLLRGSQTDRRHPSQLTLRSLCRNKALVPVQQPSDCRSAAVSRDEPMLPWIISSRPFTPTPLEPTPTLIAPVHGLCFPQTSTQVHWGSSSGPGRDGTLKADVHRSSRVPTLHSFPLPVVHCTPTNNGETKKNNNFHVSLSQASGHASHYICWCVHACACLMPACLPSSPNEASWLCARTKPNWRDSTVLALSAFYTAPPKSLPPALPLLQKSWRTMDGWTDTPDLEMASVFVKIFCLPAPLARAGITKSTATAPDLAPWLLTTTVFSASITAVVMLRRCRTAKKEEI